MTKISKNILIVEDDKGVNILIQKKLKDLGYTVDGVFNGKDAIKWGKENEDALFLLDYKLPDIKAEDVINELSKENKHFYFIVITGAGDVKIAVEMMKLGIQDFIIKESGFLDSLPDVVKKVFEEIKKENKLFEAQKALKKSEESYKLLAENIIDVIWIIDKKHNITYVSNSIQNLLKYSPEQIINKPITEILAESSSKKTIKIFNDILKNKNNNSKTLEVEILDKDQNLLWAEFRISLLRDPEKGALELLGVARDITKRKHTEIKLKESFRNLRKALEASIQAMGKTTEIRDPFTSGHQRGVAKLAFKIAVDMKLNNEQCEGVRLAAGIHDIGKIYVPAEILSKPGKIDENEFAIIKSHSQVGYDILKTIDFPWPIADIVLQHHERMNGKGYPFGITGEKMLLEAKIIAVADVVEAMASYRPYRAALGLDKAMEEIKKNSGTLYDNKVVESCVVIIEKHGFNFDE